MPDVSQMLVNFGGSIPALMRLVTGSAYLAGFYMVISGVAGLRNTAYISSPGQGQTTVWDLLRKIFVGALLIYLPSTIDMGAATFWASTSPFAYENDSNNAFQQVIDIAFDVVYLVGTIAAIKGLYELSHLQGAKKEDGSHQSGLSKGITHFFGGVMCINLHLTLSTIFTTLGITGIIN